MNTVHNRERKRLMVRFAAFYAISLGLATLIMVSLYSSRSIRPGTLVSADDRTIIIEQDRILKQSTGLETSLKLLQGYDEEYYNLLSTSTRGSALRNVIEKIKITETGLSKRIIDLKNEKSGFHNTNNTLLAEKIIRFNLFALKSRTNLAIIRNSLDRAGDNATSDQELKLKWISQLAEKDQKIIQLEKEIAGNLSTNGVKKLSAGSLIMENESLRLSVTESVKKFQSATEVSQGLKKENARLTEQLGELQKASRSGRNLNAERSNAEILNAELTLAQVNCNLARADAKQIISNARQRRELLNEALAILNTMAKSENVEIRQMVNEKITALNYISKNIRE